VTQLWYLHKHTTQVHLTDQIRSINAQCNAVYPKICFRKCSHFSSRGGKIQKIFRGRIPPDPPASTYDTTPNFLSPTTICHLSTLNIVWSLFVDAHPPPPDKFLKKPCVQIISLYEDGAWVRVMVGQSFYFYEGGGTKSLPSVWRGGGQKSFQSLFSPFPNPPINNDHSLSPVLAVLDNFARLNMITECRLTW
jgi:hypothetical protein